MQWPLDRVHSGGETNRSENRITQRPFVAWRTVWRPLTPFSSRSRVSSYASWKGQRKGERERRRRRNGIGVLKMYRERGPVNQHAKAWAQQKYYQRKKIGGRVIPSYPVSSHFPPQCLKTSATFPRPEWKAEIMNPIEFKAIPRQNLRFFVL